MGLERPAYAVTLPEKREYTIIGGGVSRWFRLVGAKVTPETGETDRFTIRVSATSHDSPGTEYSSFQFYLKVGDKSQRPRDTFMDTMGTEPKDKDLVFIIPAGTTQATFTLTNSWTSKDIPLDLTPPASTAVN